MEGENGAPRAKKKRCLKGEEKENVSHFSLLIFFSTCSVRHFSSRGTWNVNWGVKSFGSLVSQCSLSLRSEQITKRALQNEKPGNNLHTPVVNCQPFTRFIRLIFQIADVRAHKDERPLDEVLPKNVRFFKLNCAKTAEFLRMSGRSLRTGKQFNSCKVRNYVCKDPFSV